jgi:hypothetical protein
MKIKLLPIVALTGFAMVAMVPSMAFAGDHCESMHKNMSAEQWQEFKKNHDWVFSDDAGDMNKSSIHHKQSDKNAKDQAPAKDKNGLIGA